VNSLDLIRKFRAALPGVQVWIDTLLEENKKQAVPVINLAFSRLQKVFSADLLNNAKAVVVTGKVPFPPLSRMGLPEFAQMETMSMAGITYKDTFFVSYLHQTESLHFHEMVHVVQWERLGVDDFLLAYGVGLMQFGYRDSPLEQMAYSLQEGFERRNLPPGVVDLIRQKTDAIWASVAPRLLKV